MGAVGKSVDDNNESDYYILTGFTSQTVETPYTGTICISTLKMYLMSLFESGECINGLIKKPANSRLTLIKTDLTVIINSVIK